MDSFNSKRNSGGLFPLAAAFSIASIFNLPVLTHLVFDGSGGAIVKSAAAGLSYTPRALAAAIAQRAPFEVGAGPYIQATTSSGSTVTHTYDATYFGTNIGPWTVFGVKIRADSSNQVTLSTSAITVTGTLANRVAFSASDTVQAGRPGPGGNNSLSCIVLPFQNDSSTQGEAIYCPLIVAGAGAAPFPTSTLISLAVAVTNLPSGATLTTELLTIGHVDIQDYLARSLHFGGRQSFGVAK